MTRDRYGRTLTPTLSLGTGRGGRLACWELVVAVAVLLATTSLSRAQSADEFADTWAFTPKTDTFASSAFLDLRDMNETTAGGHGFIRLSADGRSFVRGDGQPIRFWCVGSGEYQADAAELASHARFLAKMGVNMVRIHAQIWSTDKASKVTDTNDKEIDGIWRAVAAFRKQGIYVTISPYWATGMNVDNWGIDGYTGQSDLWGVLFFNPRLQEGYKAWVRKLYTQVNPYTGVALAKDPAVAIIQVQNEDGLFFWTLQSMKKPQQDLLGRFFGQWLVRAYGSLDKARAAWSNSSADGDDWNSGIAAVLPVWAWLSDDSYKDGRAVRVTDTLHFLADTERRFYTDMAAFYRNDLGCGQLINASNWTTADAVRLGDLGRYANTSADVMAVNKYFTGVHVGPNDGWRIDEGDGFTNNPAVLNPRMLPTNLKQPVGHPMLITESTWVSPMDDQSEGPFLMAAYQSLCGVSGFYWFSCTTPQYDTDPFMPWWTLAGGQHPLRKWSNGGPMLMGMFPAAAMMYRRGDLAQADPVIIERRPLADLYARKVPLLAEDAGFDPNRYAGERGAQSNIAGAKVDPMAFLVGPVAAEYGSNQPSTVRDISSFIDDAKKIVKSATGQIAMHYGDGYCTIDSPKSQGACGLLAKAGAIQLSTIGIDSKNQFASVLVVALDDKSLDQSRSVLVQIGTRARPTGWIEQAAKFPSHDGKTTYDGFKIINTGQSPWRIVTNRATVTIRNTLLSHARALDANGYAGALQNLERSATGASLALPADGLYFLLTP